MDWAAIASILSERTDRPLALLDRCGRIRMFNRAMERVLGWRRFEVEGELWATACTPAEHQDEARRWISDALRGALWSFEARSLCKSGVHILFGVEFSLVGRGASQGLLITVIQWKPAEPEKPSVGQSDFEYDVVTDPSAFGLLARLVVDGERVLLPEGNPRCFEVIHGLQRPCEQCPLASSDEAPWPRVAVRHVQPNPDSVAAFEIRSADSIETGRARVRLRSLSTQALEAIHAAKMQQLADRAELSAREREVLTHLLLGRTIEDIASLIGIAARTVKYHQANVLQKLGADSRSDLMRLLF